MTYNYKPDPNIIIEAQNHNTELSLLRYLNGTCDLIDCNTSSYRWPELPYLPTLQEYNLWDNRRNNYFEAIRKCCSFRFQIDWLEFEPDWSNHENPMYPINYHIVRCKLPPVVRMIATTEKTELNIYGLHDKVHEFRLVWYEYMQRYTEPMSTLIHHLTPDQLTDLGLHLSINLTDEVFNRMDLEKLQDHLNKMQVEIDKRMIPKQYRNKNNKANY